MSIKKGLNFLFITNCSNFLNMLFALCITKFINKEIFAQYSIVTSIALGLGAFYQIIHYLLSKHVTKHQDEIDFNLENILSIIFKFSLFISLLLTFISYFIIANVYSDINFNRYIFIYIFFTSFFVCLTNSQMGILNGKELHSRYSIFIFSVALFRFVSLLFLIFILSIGFAPYLSNLFANFLLFILLLFFFKYNYFYQQNSNLFFTTKTLFKSFINENRIIIFNILLLFILYTDIFFYSLNRSINEIAVYSVHSMFAKILYFLIIPLSIFFFPKFSKKKIEFKFKNIYALIIILVTINIFFYFSVEIFFKYFYSSYEFEKKIFLFLIITFTLLALFQISGEYLATRYVDKSYIYIITFLIIAFIIKNFINNYFFVESLLSILLLLVTINIFYFYKKKFL